MTEPPWVDLLRVMERIDRKLDTLVRALGEELDEVGQTLDGDLLPGERDPSQPL